MAIRVRAPLAFAALVALLVSAGAALAAADVPVSPDEVVRGDPARPWVSLVFNAGAGYEPAVEILDTLADRGVRTSFFLLGWWAERNHGLVQRMGAEHEVASHGHSVFDLTSVSNGEVVADLERADAVISEIIGRSTRPLWSPSAGYRDARVRGIAASIGYRPIYWTVDSGDWTTDATADRVQSRVLDNAVNGAIIVMHFDSPRTRTSTAAILPTVIDTLRDRGYRLVTVSELIAGVLEGD
ncbi:MAG: polysaccharide deacetylase [Chloroflexi bacterium]|nr:polysaccharide deacetylase [Chloroflexota bacterium]